MSPQETSFKTSDGTTTSCHMIVWFWPVQPFLCPCVPCECCFTQGVQKLNARMRMKAIQPVNCVCVRNIWSAWTLNHAIGASKVQVWTESLQGPVLLQLKTFNYKKYLTKRNVLSNVLLMLVIHVKLLALSFSLVNVAIWKELIPVGRSVQEKKIRLAVL